jgi:glycosyltransferase involved in cell wall biosynthesis
MRIAVDARELVGRTTGVGRYLGELLAEWSRSRDALQHEWTLYAPQPLTVPAPFAANVRMLPGSSGTSWEQWRLGRALAVDRPDVLFAPGYTAPLTSPCPFALTVHDASFAAHPEWFTFREGVRRRMLTRLSAKRARVILTVSAFSRDEIVRHLDVSRARVRVIPLGVRRPSAGNNRRDRREPIVLFVGSIFNRRHVDALVRAFATVVAPRVAGSRLEIVGENRSYPRMHLERTVTLQSLDVQRRIAIRSYVDEQTLADLYARAAVFAYPSEYEGFGLTPLEALAAGVVPVVLDTPVASEIFGPAARYVANRSPLETRLGEAIAQALTSETVRDDVLRHAPSVLARYVWEKTAAATLAALDEAARG